jgi:UDPglucose 6-dehydrogenase
MQGTTYLKIRKISVFGIGYVGSVYAAGFASKKLQVWAFDVDKKKVKLVGSGTSPAYEPGLTKLLKACVKNGSLKATDDPEEAVLESDATFITVSTPSSEDGSINLKHVAEASRMIGEALRKKPEWHLIIMKSTVTPGTTEDVTKKIVESSSGKFFPEGFGLAVNPEFLKEGNAVEGFVNPDRILIGANDSNSRVALEEVYSTFDSVKIFTSIRTAELIKYVNNAFLAMKVSFINMMANLCQRIDGVDIKQVAEAIGVDERIGRLFLNSGPGWGGSCWPKDLRALKRFGLQAGVTLPLVDSTLQINDMQPYRMIELAEKLIGSLHKRRVAILGLSFKPNTDDTREAVSIRIVEKLLAEGADVSVYDPAAMTNFKREFGKRVKYARSAIECLKETDCALLVTEWDEFKKLKPDDFIRNMRAPAVVDGRRVFDAAAFSDKLRFAAIGFGTQEHLNPALAVNAIIANDGKVLLVRRGIRPFMSLWSLPGGFVEYDESVEGALTREIEEETGLLVKPKELVNVYSEPLRSPIKHVVTLCYVANVVSGSTRPSIESTKTRFFPLAALPRKLAFDHSKMLNEYMERIGRH